MNPTESARHPTTGHEAGGHAHPQKWSSYALEIYSSRRPPRTGTVSFEKLEQLAREKLKDNAEAFMYTFGSAGTCSTEHANRRAFARWGLVPRMLRDTTVRDLQTTIFGTKLSAPLFIAPVGVQGIVHPDGELATARAAQALGVPFILSTAATRPMEKIAEANGDGHRWYQLYWPHHDDVTLSFLKRAKANGFSALVVTLDTMILGWRAHDLDKAYLPFGQGIGIQNGIADPAFMARHNLQPMTDDTIPFPYDPVELERNALAGEDYAKQHVFLGREWLREANSGQFRSWDDLKLIRDNWEGPLVLKGIQSVQDALMAIEAGVNGIIVSNHGGRQVDGAIPSLHALDKICANQQIARAQREGNFTVLFDSGIRTGSDIIKAVALGAQAILLGRPYMYGLAVDGQEGVEHVVRTILGDMEITLGLCGYKDLEEIWGKREEIMERLDSV